MGNSQGFEKPAGDFTHEDMLWFILEAWLTAPGNDKQGRDPKREIERRQRIHGVAKPRVLAHDDGLPPGQPSAGSDGYSFAFARRSYIVEVAIADNAVDQRRQKTTRHAGI